MGLSAIVLDPSAEGSADPTSTFAEANLGNVAMVAHLRARAANVLSEPSLLLSRVLYSGSHSGDDLPPDLISIIRTEMSLLRSDTDADVQSFCTNMTKILDVASEHNLPILFV